MSYYQFISCLYLTVIYMLFQATIECRFTPKHVCDMIITYSIISIYTNAKKMNAGVIRLKLIQIFNHDEKLMNQSK